MKKVLVGVLSAAMVLSMSTFAFAGETEGDGTAVSQNARVDWRNEDLTQYKDMKLKIGYAPATMNNPFWLAVLDGVQEAIDAAGADCEVIPVSGEADQSLINEGINNLLADGIDYLLAAPADDAAAESAFKAANEAGVPVKIGRASCRE